VAGVEHQGEEEDEEEEGDESPLGERDKDGESIKETMGKVEFKAETMCIRRHRFEEHADIEVEEGGIGCECPQSLVEF
jgi:hypothetical protein